MSFATALTAGSSLLGGFSEFQSNQYQARVARRNAEIALFNANLATDAAQENAMQSDIQLKDILGQQSATQGASGLSGRTQELVRESTRRVGRQDALNIAKEGESTARNYLQEQANFLGEEKSLKNKAKMALIGGAAGAASSYYQGGGSLLGDALPNRSTAGLKYNRWAAIKNKFNTYKGR